MNGVRYVEVKPKVSESLLFPASNFLSDSVRKAASQNPQLPVVFNCSQFTSVDYTVVKVITRSSKK